MGNTSEILFLLLGQLSVGGVVLLAVISNRQLGLSFFKLNGLIFFILMGVGLPGIPVFSSHQGIASFLGSWIGLTIVMALAYSVCLFVYVVTFWIKKETHATGWLFGAAACGVAMVLSSALTYAGRVEGTLQILIPINFLLSSLVLGSALLGMLLGHRYLTNPHLPLAHLNVLAWIFLIAIILQGVLTVGGFVTGLNRDAVLAALRLESVMGLFFWIRLAIGIAMPLVLAVMILNTIRYQANMSATGLLYIAVLMVMAGEAFSRYVLLSQLLVL